MSDLKAILFDVDGTLADTERDGHRVAFNRAFVDAGLDWEWSENLYGELLAVTGGKERILFYLDSVNKAFDRPDNVSEFIAGLHASKTVHYTKMLAEGLIPLRVGVRRLLEEVKAEGVRMAIVTTTTPANVSALLSNSLAEDGEDWFEVIAAGDIVPAKKPAPDIFLWAMNEMQLSPDECLVLEDSDNGSKSVVAAGIKSLVVTVNGYTQDQNFSGAGLIVDQLGQSSDPAKLISGDLYGRDIVDLAVLKQFHRNVHAS